MQPSPARGWNNEPWRKEIMLKVSPKSETRNPKQIPSSIKERLKTDTCFDWVWQREFTTAS